MMPSTDAWIPTGPADAPLRSLDLDGGGASINQRTLRRDGLAGWQVGTTSGLLAAWELMEPPGVFFDVGANAGLYALLCRLLWPAAEVVAFEPSPTTVAAGERWARANGTEVRFEPFAVSDDDGHATLYLSERSDASNSLVEGFRTASGVLEVERLTLDTFVARTGLVPDVVKVDVEQHEPAVVAGATRTLLEHRPVVIMETLGTGSSQRAHEALLALGYGSHGLDDRDRLYWPGPLPDGWHDRFEGWRTAVTRCVPRPSSAAAAERRRRRPWRRVRRPR